MQTWRLCSSESGDALRGHDDVNLEAMIEPVCWSLGGYNQVNSEMYLEAVDLDAANPQAVIQEVVFLDLVDLEVVQVEVVYVVAVELEAVACNVQLRL